MNNPPAMPDDISRRKIEFYTLGHKGPPEEAPFYESSLDFDSEPGAFNAALVKTFNELAAGDPSLTGEALDLPEIGRLPASVVLIDASNDRLPTGPESFRVLCHELGQIDPEIRATLVNEREELIETVGRAPSETLVISECVDATAYNVDVVEELEGLGAVVVPGRVTAPGSIFSDKGSTYEMLNAAGLDRLPARHVRIPAADMSTPEVVSAILEGAKRARDDWGCDRFYVKPVTGGSGVGGFRITITPRGYLIPDFSKLTGELLQPEPILLDVDPADDARLDELLWIFSMFNADPYYRKQYLWTNLDALGERFGANEPREALRSHIMETRARQGEVASEKSKSADETHAELLAAVEKYESHFSRRYDPVLCEHIDFGAWGLRAHFRLTTAGMRLESIYARIFQLALTDEGVGYVGNDNISNKHTGVLENLRLTPIKEIMVAAVGGRERFLDILADGARAASALVATQSAEARRRVPVRCQIDLAPIEGKMGEGNADAARGSVLGMPWNDFVENMQAWFRDCLRYYSLKQDGK